MINYIYMKKILRYIVSGITLLYLGSCSGFLDQKPHGKLEQSDINNVADCQKLINGIYAVWETTGGYSKTLTLAPDIQCDLAYSVITSTNDLGNIYGWKFSSGEEYVTSAYSTLYKVISNVNLLLQHKDGIAVAEDQKVMFDNLIGAAYFSRALAYTELAKLFSEAYDPAKAESQLGVSIWSTFGIGNPGRSSLAETYEQIFEDLKLAKQLVNEDAADSKRITQGAVDALYARVYLYMQNWTEAAAAASRVIENTKYSLADASDFTVRADNTISGADSTDFYRMWRYDRSNEIIWKLSYNINDMPGALGYLFCLRNGSTYSVCYVPSAEILGMYDQQNDGRFHTYFTEGSIKGSPWYIMNKYPGNPDFQTGSKYVYSNMPKVFRLAEMYLIRAEAYARSVPAREDLANADLASLRSKRIKNYVHTNKNGAALLQEIKDERVKELYMEGQRLYDLKRYNDGFSRTPQVQTISPDDKLNITPGNFRFIWPIPSHEMNANKNMVQNPGF